MGTSAVGAEEVVSEYAQEEVSTHARVEAHGPREEAAQGHQEGQCAIAHSAHLREAEDGQPQEAQQRLGGSAREEEGGAQASAVAHCQLLMAINGSN